MYNVILYMCNVFLVYICSPTYQISKYTSDLTISYTT